jgi:hypothetical protein
LNRLANPAWRKISNLGNQQAFEVAATFLLHRFLRMMLRTELVVPLEKIGDATVSSTGSDGPSERLVREIRNVCPLSPDLREKLIDEAELGLLVCSIANSPNDLQLSTMNPKDFIEVVGCLALAEMNRRRNRQEPSTLAQTGYAPDPVECQLQVTRSWSHLMAIQDPDVPGALLKAYFEIRWQTCLKDLPKRFSAGLGRTDRDEALKLCRQECRQLDATGLAIIAGVYEKMRKARGANG